MNKRLKDIEKGEEGDKETKKEEDGEKKKKKKSTLEDNGIELITSSEDEDGEPKPKEFKRPFSR